MKSIDSGKQTSDISSHISPNGVTQHVKPKRQNTIQYEDVNNSTAESEEFDSDEHIENSSDWHEKLDVVQMPHLLGPSATKHSPIPVEYQHYSIFSAPPFSCQQILVQFSISGPSLSLVPCSYQPYTYYDYYKSNSYSNQFQMN